MLDHALHGPTDAPPLVLLHSGAMTRHEWDPYLEGLGSAFRLIVPTALGHGASPAVAEPAPHAPADPLAAPFTLSAMGAAVLALLDLLDIPRAHFLGSSMGGRTALWIALNHPQRVDRLIVFRSSYHSRPETHEAVARMADPETWRSWGLESWVRREHSPQGGPDAWISVARRVSEMLHQDLESQTSLADLARLASPTLLICGDRDPVVPLTDVIEMHNAIPDSALWIAPNATHFLGTDSWRRPAFQTEVLRFLQRPNAAPNAALSAQLPHS